MNDKLRNFAKQELKDGISKCSNAQKFLFMQMYSHKNTNLTIDVVVDNMPDDKLDWAMEQVRRTLEENHDR